MTQSFERGVRWTLSITLALALAGCGGPPERAPVAAKSGTSAPSDSTPATSASGTDSNQSSAEATVASTTTNQAPKPEPIKPPATVAELDKIVVWEDRPVKLAIKLFEQETSKTKPLLTVAEALAMHNNSDADNTKILSALGRLPEKPADANWNDRITRHLLGEVNNTNPIMIDSVQEFDLEPVIQYQPMIFDWNFIPFADANLVEKWQTSKDHLCDKLILRRDITWSDGKPITARDMAFTFRAVMNKKIPVPAMRATCEKLSDVVAYDDATVVFFHKEALATGDWYLQWPAIPEHVYAPLYAKLDNITWEELLQTPEYQETENHPVCGGQYTLTSRVRGQEIVCKRREGWYMHEGKQVRDKPYFSEIRFRVMEDFNTARLALMSGEIDEYEIPVDQWATQTDSADFYKQCTKSFGVEWLYWFFGWNVNSPAAPFFQDRRVREAMAYAYDYREMFDKYLHGLSPPCTGIWYPTARFAPRPPNQPYHQDLDKAEQLLDEAGWMDSDGDGVRDKMIDGQRVPFEFTVLVRQHDTERLNNCALLQQCLRKIRVRCNVQQIEATVLFDRLKKHDFQAFYGGWGTGSDPDDADNLWMTHAIDDGRNFQRYSSPEVDRLFEAGRREFNPEKRDAIYAKIDEIIYHDQPCLFLFWRNDYWGFNKRLRGYMFSPRGPYHYDPGFFSLWSAQ